jgi:transglutaminase-like putative cysteine protease
LSTPQPERNADAPRVTEPMLSAWLRPIIYAGAVAVFAIPLVTADVALWLGACAGMGGVVGRKLAGSRLRLLPIVALSLGGLGVAGLLGALLTGTDVLAATVGPAAAVHASQATAVGLGTLSLSLGVRAAALRVRLLRALEVAFVGLSFAQLVVSHRGGSINRPFELADSIIAAGGDPAEALLAIGAVAAVIATLVLLDERSPLRLMLHLLLVALVLSGVVGVTHLQGPPQPSVDSSGLGLRKDQEGRKGRQGPGQGEGQPPQDDLEFRDNNQLEGRQIPLAVVLLHDDYSPPGGIYYFRQRAYSQYNGRRLVGATREGVDEDLPPAFVYEPTPIEDAPRGSADRVELETTVALLSDHTRPFALEAPLSLRPEQNPDPGRFRRVYRVRSAALASDYMQLLGREAVDPEWDAAVREHYTAHPDDPRYEELARKIVSDLPVWVRDDPVAQAMRVSEYLGKQGIYSLRSKHAHAGDPTADFLFGDLTGYCVHFAHAAAYLLRALDIPTRVSAGYIYDESSRQGGSAILLAGANSHAWAEIHVQGVGWIVVDVNPERSLDPAMAPPDTDLQRLLGEMARGLDPVPPSEQRPFEPVAAFVRDLPRLIGRTLAVLLPLILLLGYATKLWRRLSPHFARPAQAARLSYRAQLDRFSEVALTRRFGESREAFAARVAAAAPSFTALTRDHVGSRFGRTPAPREAVAKLAEAARRELALAVPRGRRLLGLLNPFSWLRSR